MRRLAWRRWYWLPALLLAPLSDVTRADPPAGAGPSSAPRVDFARDILPLLRQSCFSCHGPEAEEAGLRLDQKQRALAGGDGGPILVAGRPAESRLLAIVRGQDEQLGRMPPEGEGTPLGDGQIDLLRRWIEQGAAWPDEGGPAALTSRHWSFQPLRPVRLPAVRDTAWPRNGIDRFVLARLERQGLAPSPPAERATLLRRLYLDLWGLPPAPAELQAFLQDTRPDAYERLVDRLLASPHYGERWGRHWLDLARYADSDGYEKDRPRPHAWRYRSWVIDALNRDLPFDQFTVAQIAGDMLPDAPPEQRIAAGFHRNTLHNTEGGIDPEEDRVKKTVDRTNTLGSIWLGLTVGCAQCHSHKYDPITQREYYALYAFFNDLDEVELDGPFAGCLAGGADARALSVRQRAEPRQAYVQLRGDFLHPGDPVEPQVPAVLPPVRPRGKRPDRLDLARWVVGADNPLTARVTVNRIWARLFGRGLVRTVDDLGDQGDAPSHPQLLDWLASELQATWSLKSLQRQIVTSATYRQSSAVRPDLAQIDPQNALLARQARLRVEAEIIRDLALAVSGLLDPRLGGPSVRPPQPAEYSALTYAGSAQWKVSAGGDASRRGLYTFFQRTSPYPMLMTFDAPDANGCCPQRDVSNTPLQALTLWNDPVFFACARAFGRRIVADVPWRTADEQTARQRARHAVRCCLARDPAPDELRELLALHGAFRGMAAAGAGNAELLVAGLPLPPGAAQDDVAAWILVGRTLLNLDEFITRE